MTLKDEATERRLHADALSPAKTSKPARKPRTAAQKIDDAKRAKARRASKGAKPRGGKVEKAEKPRAKTEAKRSKKIAGVMSEAEAAGIDQIDWSRKVRKTKARLEAAESALGRVSKAAKEKLAAQKTVFETVVTHVPDDSGAAKHNGKIRSAYQALGEVEGEVSEEKSIAKKKRRDAQAAFDRCFVAPNQLDLPEVKD